MKILRVRIVKADKDYWYSDKIGQEMDVFENFDPCNHPFWYRVIPVGTHDIIPINCYISIGDFEVIEEYDGKPVQRIVISIERNATTRG